MGCLDCAHEKTCPNPIGKHKYCETAAYKGDGICDNGNNNCMCGWDGGDCCGKDNNYHFCGTECQCFEPRQKCGGFCRREKWLKDGICDVENNNCGCGWDGGDCCGKNAKDSQFAYCKKDCFCKNPQSKGFSSKRGAACSTACAKASDKNNKVCDDANNTCGCGWDGGDCCAAGTDKSKCKDCGCKDPFVVDG